MISPKSKWKIIFTASVLVLLMLFYTPIISALKQNGVLKAVPAGDSLRVLDVGEGDAILITSGGKTALIDTGNISDMGNALIGKLHDIGIEKIDSLILTHIHIDHTGGALAVMSQFEIGTLYYVSLFTNEPQNEVYFKSLRKYVRENNISTKLLKNQSEINIGDFDLMVLCSDINGKTDEDEVNNSSAVIRAVCHKASFLLTADIEEKGERYLLANFKEMLSCDVLKVAHHGGETSSTGAFLMAAKPRLAAISCGAGNIYGHPSEKVLARLEKVGAKVYRTDINGDLTFNVARSGKITVRTAKKHRQ